MKSEKTVEKQQANDSYFVKRSQRLQVLQFFLGHPRQHIKFCNLGEVFSSPLQTTVLWNAWLQWPGFCPT